jgi:hypothetical protein
MATSDAGERSDRRLAGAALPALWWAVGCAAVLHLLTIPAVGIPLKLAADAAAECKDMSIAEVVLRCGVKSVAILVLGLPLGYGIAILAWSGVLDFVRRRWHTSLRRTWPVPVAQALIAATMVGLRIRASHQGHGGDGGFGARFVVGWFVAPVVITWMWLLLQRPQADDESAISRSGPM